METQTNDKNSNGTRWYQENFYGNPESDTIFPEEDYQVAALPISTLVIELGRRLNIMETPVLWMSKTIDFSAVTDGLLLHTISLKLGDV